MRQKKILVQKIRREVGSRRVAEVVIGGATNQVKTFERVLQVSSLHPSKMALAENPRISRSAMLLMSESTKRDNAA